MATKQEVLIVEDEESLAQMYKTKFEREGYQVIVAVDGAVGLELAVKNQPDIILLDIILPQKDGFMVLKELKENKKTKDIKVLMLTNLGQDEDMVKGKKLGAADYLLKADLTPAQLVDKVIEHLK